MYHLSHNGTDERFTFGSFLYKKETYFSEWVSGKLQCEAFIGPKGTHTGGKLDTRREGRGDAGRRRCPSVPRVPVRAVRSAPGSGANGNVSLCLRAGSRRRRRPVGGWTGARWPGDARGLFAETLPCEVEPHRPCRMPACGARARSTQLIAHLMCICAADGFRSAMPLISAPRTDADADAAARGHRAGHTWARPLARAVGSARSCGSGCNKHL